MAVSNPVYDEDTVTLGYLNDVIDELSSELSGDISDTTTLAESKTQNFGTTPTTPYYVNDTYMDGTDIYICTTERLIGSFNAGDWSLASEYTDDTLAESKSQVFTNTPTTPYSVGDLWTEGPNGELRRCVYARTNLESYTESDWENATDYDNTETIVEGGLVTTGTVEVVQGGTVSAGITGNTSGDTSVRFWAGSTLANRATAPFRVTQAGALTCTGATVSGAITATSGSFTGSITSTSGTIGGFTLGSSSLTASQVGIGTGTYSFWAGDNTASSADFRVTNAGRLTCNSATINGTISSSTITGSSIACGNVFSVTSAGVVSYNNGVGFIKLNPDINDHPYISAINLRYSTTGGISFRDETSSTSVGSEIAGIRVKASSGALHLIVPNGTINLNTSYTSSTNNVGIMQLRVSNNALENRTTGADASVQVTAHDVILWSTSGYSYINGTSASNLIAVSSSGPSSLNVKKDIKRLNYKDIYNELKNMDIYSYKYKYKGISERKKEYGFIIDEIEKLPTLSKIALNYDETKYIHNNTLYNKKKEDNDKELNYKSWDRDSYIKLLFAINKALQYKIDKLEERIEKLEKGGR